MVEFIGLSLDGSKIVNAIASFPGLKTVNSPTLGKDFKTYTFEVEDQQAALIQVFERGDALFTLKYKLGKNQPLSLKMAEHIAAKCGQEPITVKPLSLKLLSEDDWQFLQESLTADGFALTAEAHQHAERFKVTGPGNDQVWIHRFNTGNFLMQGRTRGAYSAVVHALSYTSTEKKDLIESQIATVTVTVADTASLMADLEQRLPAAWPKMDDTVKCMLAPALIVHKLSVDLPDYTLLVFPAIRGMEGCIKDIFGKKGYFPGGKKLSVGDQFDQDKKVTSTARVKVGCQATCESVEKIYSHFSNHRNGLLHVDWNLGIARIVENQAEAIEIVDTSLHVIEQAYAALP